MSENEEIIDLFFTQNRELSWLRFLMIAFFLKLQIKKFLLWRGSDLFQFSRAI